MSSSQETRPSEISFILDIKSQTISSGTWESLLYLGCDVTNSLIQVAVVFVSPEE